MARTRSMMTSKQAVSPKKSTSRAKAIKRRNNEVTFRAAKKKQVDKASEKALEKVPKKTSKKKPPPSKEELEKVSKSHVLLKDGMRKLQKQKAKTDIQFLAGEMQYLSLEDTNHCSNSVDT